MPLVGLPAECLVFFLTPLFNLSLAMSFHVICIRPRRPLNADGTTTAGDHRLLGAYLMNKTTVFWRFQVISYQVLGLKLLWLLCTSCLAQTLLSICPDLSKCFVPLRAAVLMCVATQIKVCLWHCKRPPGVHQKEFPKCRAKASTFCYSSLL